MRDDDDIVSHLYEFRGNAYHFYPNISIFYLLIIDQDTKNNSNCFVQQTIYG